MAKIIDNSIIKCHNKAMKYKLIVTDYDSTILRSDYTISEYTRKVIAEYRRRGGIFTVSTGRAHSSIINDCLPALGISDNIPVTSYQGALIKETKTGKNIFLKHMQTEAATSAAEFFDSRNHYVQLYFENDIVCNRDSEFRAYYKKITGNEPRIISGFDKNLKQFSDSSLIKIMAVAEPEDLRDSREYILNNFGNRLRAECTGPYMMEVYDIEAGKGNALKYLAELLKIPQASVAAFGDSDNDVGMIEYAGLGVAVENGCELIKSKANRIARSCDEDGVARFIETEVL